jgi:IS5 family transposase
MFKMVFLPYFYDLSERNIEEQCTWNLIFKSFLGLSARKLPPDHTALCRLREAGELRASSVSSTK